MINRPSWDETWLSVAEIVSRRSRCSRAQIGAVIVSENQRICATGYNGPAASWPYEGDCVNWCQRARGESALDNVYDACPAIHAEANALMYVDRSSVLNGTVYVTSAPCMQCAKLISNSGVSKLVCIVRPEDSHREPEVVFEYLRACNIELDVRWSDHGNG